jgi:hypothetical protein
MKISQKNILSRNYHRNISHKLSEEFFLRYCLNAIGKLVYFVSF